MRAAAAASDAVVEALLRRPNEQALQAAVLVFDHARRRGQAWLAGPNRAPHFHPSAVRAYSQFYRVEQHLRAVGWHARLLDELRRLF